jgi:hypothetical protein
MREKWISGVLYSHMTSCDEKKCVDVNCTVCTDLKRTQLHVSAYLKPSSGFELN